MCASEQLNCRRQTRLPVVSENVFTFESIWIRTLHKQEAGSRQKQFGICLPPCSLWTLLPSAASRWDTISCGERSHVEKPTSFPQHNKQMTLGSKSPSSAQLIQTKRSSVPYQLTAFNQMPPTPSIIHSVCDSQLACCFFLFLFSGLQLSGVTERALLVLPPASPSLNSVNMSEKHNCSTGGGGVATQQITTRGENIHKYVHA